MSEPLAEPLPVVHRFIAAPGATGYSEPLYGKRSVYGVRLRRIVSKRTLQILIQSHGELVWINAEPADVLRRGTNQPLLTETEFQKQSLPWDFNNRPQPSPTAD
jgi:hypothetical protein